MPHTDQSQHDVYQDKPIPAAASEVYQCVIGRMCKAGVPFALGGGLALGVYTHEARDSKDLDLYILPEHRETVIGILNRCGLEDYFDVKEYVRGWIYRAHRDGNIVDAIWSMANRRADVDMRWVTAGPVITMFGHQLRVVPPEELIWSKLYVLQKDRCDWPDIMNVIQACGPSLDWDHLIERVGEDRPLVKAMLSVFSWVSPARAAFIPRRVWERFGLALPWPDADRGEQRKDLLDTRPWLVADPHCSAA